MKHAVKHIHFIGIGGVGMCGIAEVLLNLGYAVSGSDLADNAVTQRLARLGARIHRGHAADNIASADAVVVGSMRPQPDGRIEVRFDLVDVVKQVKLAGMSYVVTQAQFRATAHKIADVIYEKLTGDPGVFATRIAYVLRTGKLGGDVATGVFFAQCDFAIGFGEACGRIWDLLRAAIGAHQAIGKTFGLNAGVIVAEFSRQGVRGQGLNRTRRGGGGQSPRLAGLQRGTPGQSRSKSKRQCDACLFRDRVRIRPPESFHGP